MTFIFFIVYNIETIFLEHDFHVFKMLSTKSVKRFIYETLYRCDEKNIVKHRLKWRKNNKTKVLKGS